MAFVSSSYRSKWMEPFLKHILKKWAHVAILNTFPINSCFHGLPREGDVSPPAGDYNSPGPSGLTSFLFTEASFRIFLSEHKLALWKCSGARCLKAMLIRGNKMAFLLHLWPLTLTRSLKSWALAMGTNYRQRGCYAAAVEVDALGFKSSLCRLQGKHLVWWDWKGVPMELQRGEQHPGEPLWERCPGTPP